MIEFVALEISTTALDSQLPNSLACRSLLSRLSVVLLTQNLPFRIRLSFVIKLAAKETKLHDAVREVAIDETSQRKKVRIRPTSGVPLAAACSESPHRYDVPCGLHYSLVHLSSLWLSHHTNSLWLSLKEGGQTANSQSGITKVVYGFRLRGWSDAKFKERKP